MKKVLFTKEIDVIPTLFNEKIKTASVSCIAFDYLDFSCDFNGDESFIFTSVNGVKAFFRLGKKIPEGANVFCVGKKTRQQLELFQVKPRIVTKNAKNLRSELQEIAQNGQSFVHFCGNLAIPVFRNPEINYQQKHIYNTRLLFPKITDIYDAYVFFSPSGVESFIEKNRLGNAMLFSIGDTTTKVLRMYTKNTIFTSSENTLEHLVELINNKLIKGS